MTTTCLSANGLTFGYAGHTPLFHHLNIHLHAQPMALIGRNGVGKSVLLACLAGAIQPLHGTVTAHTSLAYLPQREADDVGAGSVTEWLGVAHILDALQRLEQGDGSPEDVVIVGDQWSLADDLSVRCQRFGLPTAILQQSMASLSGGQRTRLALLRLNPARDTFLLLDEPTNHLDQEGRAWLSLWVREHPGGALVVSHDQDFLAGFQHLMELRDGQLHQYGNGLAGYRAVTESERVSAEADLAHAQRTIRQEQLQRQQERERQDQRASRGKRNAARGGAPKILLGMMKARSETTRGKSAEKQEGAIAAERERANSAKERLEQLDPLSFPFTPAARQFGVLCSLAALRLPYVEVGSIDAHIRAGERWLVSGANGSGKSLLLRAMAGVLKEPVEGTVHCTASTVLLDQHLSLLDSQQSALQNFQRLNPGWTESQYRDRLAHLRLRRERALLPVASLSGGERLKVALAVALMGPRPTELLLLDEPDNHLDLESQHLLTQALQQYEGTFLLVTHSRTLAAAVLPTHRLELSLKVGKNSRDTTDQRHNK
ncbi:MAG: ABC-F family ATP-binding cassette domain-containing protein [Natronospirillum sp.]